MNIIAIHPKAVTLGIGLAITFAVGVIIGSLENNHAFAFYNPNPYWYCHKIASCD
jgi:hypothetical protein